MLTGSTVMPACKYAKPTTLDSLRFRLGPLKPPFILINQCNVKQSIIRVRHELGVLKRGANRNTQRENVTALVSYLYLPSFKNYSYFKAIYKFRNIEIVL